MQFQEKRFLPIFTVLEYVHVSQSIVLSSENMPQFNVSFTSDAVTLYGDLIEG